MSKITKLKIGIDCRCFDSEGGTKVYAVNLIKNLIINKDFEYYLFYTSNKHINSFSNDNVHEIVVPLSHKYLYFIWDQIVIPYLDIKYKIDIQHSPKGAVPILTRSKRVVTIHDLTYVILPNTVNLFDRLYGIFNLHLAAKLSSSLIFISKSTKQDFDKYFATKNKKYVVYHGLGQDSTNIETKEEKHIILYTGSLEKRKNLPNLIKAFSLVIQRFPNLKLYLVGKPGWSDPEIDSTIKVNNLADKVVRTGFLSIDDLNIVYSNTYVYTYLSTYEGFGIPILEAMSRGIPVITSNISSMPEVAGDAAMYVEPNNINEIAESLKNLYEDTVLRRSLVNKGYENITKFSWEKCSSETTKIYLNTLK